MPKEVALEQRKKRATYVTSLLEREQTNMKENLQTTLRSQIQNDFYTTTNDKDEETKSKEVSPPPNVLPFDLKRENTQGMSFMQKFFA